MTTKILKGNEAKKSQGDFVHQGQKMGAAHGFKNVSEKWLTKTISFEDGLALLEKGKAATEDVMATPREMRPMVADDGRFVLKLRDGRSYVPTEHSVSQMGAWGQCGRFPLRLLENPTDSKGEALYSRDRGDSETLVRVFENGFRRLEQDKKFLFRTRQDGTLRAMLSDKYAIVENRWFIESLAKLIPGGRLSHWRGDSDSIWGNVLIPDTIRAEEDSEYGGMLSVGNSEIGERTLFSLPSIFRAICQNGCIWGQEKGERVKVVHKGKIDLDELYLLIKENLDRQIPLLPDGIVRLLKTKEMDFVGSPEPLFAQLAIQSKFSKKQASGLLLAYAQEPAKSLFGLVNAVTRAGQELSNEQWFASDLVGGVLTNYTADHWSAFKKRAAALPPKEVEAAFRNAV